MFQPTSSSGQTVGALDNPNSEFSQAFTDVQRMQMIRVILQYVKPRLPCAFVACAESSLY